MIIQLSLLFHLVAYIIVISGMGLENLFFICVILYYCHLFMIEFLCKLKNVFMYNDNLKNMHDIIKCYVI